MQQTLDAIVPEIDHLRTVLRDELRVDEERIDRLSALIIRYALAQMHVAHMLAAVDADDWPATIH